MRDGITSDEFGRIRVLEREVKELRRANEILSLSGHRHAVELCEPAIQARPPQPVVGIGFNYVSIRYAERLAEAGVEPLVGSKGDIYDNELAETINGQCKVELIHQGALKNMGSR